MDDDDVVTWVASQSPIPALQALIREAEREKKSTPSPGVSSLPPPALSRHPTHQLTRVASKPYVSQEEEEEPEVVAFVELLKDAFKKLDENSLKKQRLVARTREKQRERTKDMFSARPLIKTSSASAITLQSTSTSHPRGRALAKTASLGPSDDTLSGKSTPSSHPNSILNCDPKPASAPPLLARVSRASTIHPTANSSMQDIIDLTETDIDWERSLRPPTPRADNTMCMQVDDDDDSDTMDTSFFHPEPPPQSRVPISKPKPQLISVPRPPAQTQRTRSGHPVLGMRRVPHLQPSQYSSSQNKKAVTVPRFKPPMFNNTTYTLNKNGKPATTVNSRPPPRGGVPAKVAAAPKVTQANKDVDSSFDVSLDMDVDALEEAMKAYD